MRFIALLIGLFYAKKRGVGDVAPYTLSAILVGNVGVDVLDDPPPKAELPAGATRRQISICRQIENKTSGEHIRVRHY